MQEVSDTLSWPVYAGGMRTGRPTDQPRSPFGKRLVNARRVAGLSQMELADRLDVDRRVIAHWERHSVTLKPEQLVALAKALKISTDELLGIKVRQPSGPTGKVRQVFESVSTLPRRQQQKIVDVVEALVVQSNGRK